MATSHILVSYIVLAIATVLFSVFLCSDPVEGLTAFGKSPSGNDRNDKNASKPTRKSASKPCSSDTDCANIQHTVCKLDQREGKKHCKCPDDSPLDNGSCKQSGQAPGKPCSDQLKCTKNSECVTNSTKKLCVCFDGYELIDHHGYVYCSGFERLVPLTSSILYSITAFGCLRTILPFR